MRARVGNKKEGGAQARFYGASPVRTRASPVLPLSRSSPVQTQNSTSKTMNSVDIGSYLYSHY